MRARRCAAYEQVVNTIKTMCSNLTGMMCDGAKQGCALKVYSGVSAAVQAALLSMKGIKTHNDGIIDDSLYSRFLHHNRN